jgi:hypothetical protein
MADQRGVAQRMIRLECTKKMTLRQNSEETVKPSSQNKLRSVLRDSRIVAQAERLKIPVKLNGQAPGVTW